MKTNYEIVDFFAGYSVLEYLEAFSLGKSKIHKLFQNKNIGLNNKLAKRDDILHTGDVLNITSDEVRDYAPLKKKLDIVYEDDYLLIVNKPVNILVYPDGCDKVDSLANVVSYYYQNKGLDYTIKYAHRLDRDTTGLLIFAKDYLTLAAVTKMLADHSLERTYLCLAQGHFINPKGRITAKIGEDRHNSKRKRISKTGKIAITDYEVIKEFKNYSLVKVILQTGRTHQIRVHLSSIGHALLGDELYGGNIQLASRCLLHSARIKMIHPVTKRVLELEKALPYDMAKLID